MEEEMMEWNYRERELDILQLLEEVEERMEASLHQNDTLGVAGDEVLVPVLGLEDEGSAHSNNIYIEGNEELIGYNEELGMLGFVEDEGWNLVPVLGDLQLIEEEADEREVIHRNYLLGYAGDEEISMSFYAHWINNMDEYLSGHASTSLDSAGEGRNLVPLHDNFSWDTDEGRSLVPSLDNYPWGDGDIFNDDDVEEYAHMNLDLESVLMQELSTRTMEYEPVNNRRPAARLVVERLPLVTASTIKAGDRDAVADVDDDQVTSLYCAVCMDDISVEVAGDARSLPCSHHYHADCILKWLELNNTCPLCRYELPMDVDSAASYRVEMHE